MRKALGSLFAILLLFAVSGAARADDIEISGVGPTGIFPGGGQTIGTALGTNLAFVYNGLYYQFTQSSPLGINSVVPVGIAAEDPFTFTLSSYNSSTQTVGAALLTLSGYVFVDNGCATGNQAAAGCAGLFTNVTASDPSQLTGLITLSVEQQFAAPSGLMPGASLSTPVSGSLVGDCSTSSGNVTMTSTFNGSTSPTNGPLHSGPCSNGSAFSVVSTPATLTLIGGNNIDITTTMNFNLNGGSISLPAGSCIGSACVEPSTMPNPPVPEPSSLLFVASGLVALAGLKRFLVS